MLLEGGPMIVGLDIFSVLYLAVLPAALLLLLVYLVIRIVKHTTGGKKSDRT